MKHNITTKPENSSGFGLVLLKSASTFLQKRVLAQHAKKKKPVISPLLVLGDLVNFYGAVVPLLWWG